MKKLLLAIAVVACIGVTLSENDTHVKMNYDYLVDDLGIDEADALDITIDAIIEDDLDLGEAKEL